MPGPGLKRPPFLQSEAIHGIVLFMLAGGLLYLSPGLPGFVFGGLMAVFALVFLAKALLFPAAIPTPVAICRFCLHDLAESVCKGECPNCGRAFQPPPITFGSSHARELEAHHHGDAHAGDPAPLVRPPLIYRPSNDPTPPFVSHRRKLHGALLVLGFMVPIVASLSTPYRWLGLLLSALPVAAVLVYRHLDRSRLRRRLRTSNCLLCWHCGYSLANIGPDGVCPECGRPYDAFMLRLDWLQSGFITMTDFEEAERNQPSLAGRSEGR